MVQLSGGGVYIMYIAAACYTPSVIWKFQDYLKEHDIIHYASSNQLVKASVAENFVKKINYWVAAF